VRTVANRTLSGSLSQVKAGKIKCERSRKPAAAAFRWLQPQGRKMFAADLSTMTEWFGCRAGRQVGAVRSS
jgi:hypothetical protein